MGGGSMLRAAGRAVGAGVGSIKDVVAVANNGGRSTAAKQRRICCNASGAVATALVAEEKGMENWECVGGEEESGLELSERVVFKAVPTMEEVEDAITTIQKIIVPVTFSQSKTGQSQSYANQSEVEETILVDNSQNNSSTEKYAESESDWIEPEMNFYSSGAVQKYEREKVYDALQLLQINSSIKRMVLSLSSDKTVWDAVMNNEVVQELKKSLCEDVVDDNDDDHETEMKDDVPAGIFKWVFDNAKAKIAKFVDKIVKLVNEICHFEAKDEKDGRNANNDQFDDIVTSSFMLSVVVFIIVVVTRIHRA